MSSARRLPIIPLSILAAVFVFGIPASQAQTAPADVAPAAPTGGPLETASPQTDFGDSMNPTPPAGEIYSPGTKYGSYVIGPGDSLAVRVMPQDRYSDDQVPVLQDGDIYYPGVGRVQAAGLTVGELTAALTSRLSEYCVNPDVTVTLTALHPRVVYVTGGVAQPKVLDANAASTLAKAITLCGGVTDKNMLAHVTVLRGTTVLTANMYDLMVHGVDTGQNLALQPGDMVIVPINTARFIVLGAVGAPGAFALQQSGASTEGPERLSDAMIAAGGPRPGVAKISQIEIMRRQPGSDKPQISRFNYGKYLKDGDLTQNPILQDNDIIIVPQYGHQLTPGDILGYIPYYAFLRQLFPVL